MQHVSLANWDPLPDVKLSPSYITFYTPQQPHESHVREEPIQKLDANKNSTRRRQTERSTGEKEDQNKKLYSNSVGGKF